MNKIVLYGLAALIGVVVLACGISMGESAERKDTVATVAEPKIPMARVIDKPMFSVGVPKGWAIMVAEDSEVLLYRGKASRPEDFSKNAFLMGNVKSANGKTLDELHKMQMQEMAAKPLDDMTMYGSTFKASKMNDNGMDMLVLLKKKNLNMLVVMVPYAKRNDKELRAVIGSMKIK